MLEYLLQKPTVEKQKYPLLVLLHGYGSNEQDLFSFASELPKDAYVLSLQAPHHLQYGSYAWYAIYFDAGPNKFSDIPQAIESRELIKKFVEDFCKNHPIDTKQITLIGFSQGAILSYALALSYPETFQRIVALSGYCNTEMCVDNFAQNDFSKLQVFISHGTEDQVIPVAWARNTRDFLKNLSITYTYHEYPVGHGVAPQNFWDFKKWLE
jgi:phospholipase/carboxylesterase